MIGIGFLELLILAVVGLIGIGLFAAAIINVVTKNQKDK